MIKFTSILHGKGWLVKEFLEHWGLHRRTYERMTADPKKHDKLNKMIDAMGDKEE